MRKFGWTQKQHDKAYAVSKVLMQLTDYFPVTLRQVFYRMVADVTINNTRSESAIEAEIDMELFNEQKKIEAMEQQRVLTIRERVQSLLEKELRVV